MSDPNRRTRVRQTEIERPEDIEARRTSSEQEVKESSSDKDQPPRWINLNRYFSPLPNVAGCIVGFILAILVLLIIFIMGGHIII